jgi:hypothetical protein
MYYLVNAGIRASEAVTIGHGRASGRGAREREQGAGGDAKVYTPEWYAAANVRIDTAVELWTSEHV